MDNETTFAPLFGSPLKVINIGLELFFTAVSEQGAESAQVDWQPPAAGDQHLTKLLDQ